MRQLRASPRCLAARPPLPRRSSARHGSPHTTVYVFFRRMHLQPVGDFRFSVCVHDGAPGPDDLQYCRLPSTLPARRLLPYGKRVFPVGYCQAGRQSAPAASSVTAFGVAEPQVGFTAAAARFCDNTSPINGIEFAPTAPHCLLRSLRRRRRRRVLRRQKNQSHCLSLSSRRASRNRGFHPATSRRTLLPDQTGIIHIAIQRFGKDQLMCSAPA